MLEIEIVETNIIEGGVEVFARAWNEQGQIGFGKDGTVDIERFRIFNPPVLVEDPTGDIVREQQADEEMNIPYSRVVYREDPKEALLQSLESSISEMKNSHSAKNIVVGKRGNTTSTLYPTAGAVSPCDGQVNSVSASGTWADRRDDAVGGVAIVTANPSVCAYLRSSTTTDQYNLMARTIYNFDTSVIGTDGITSATFSLYCTATTNTSAFGGLSASVVEATPDSTSNLITSDYDIATTFGSRVASDKTFASFTTSAYNDFALDAGGLAYINKTGVTSLGTLTSAEVDNAAPTWTSNITSSVGVNHADQAGTTNDPKLVVEHSAATSSIKSVNGILRANIKSWNGVILE